MSNIQPMREDDNIDSRETLIEGFIQALGFRDDDLVELRPIETWTDQTTGEKKSRPLGQRFVGVRDLAKSLSWLQHVNETENANAFFGVAPRSKNSGKKKDIRRINCLWADIDDCTVDEVHARIKRAGLPETSITVSSGHGFHLYWLLAEPIVVPECAGHEIAPDGERVESIVKAICDALGRKSSGSGADRVQDLSRVLRLPGFLNVKDRRNGAEPRPCQLIQCDPSKRYSLDAFSKWLPADKSQPKAQPVRESRNGRTRKQVDAIAAIVARLDEPAAENDRSKRDYAVLCSLIEFGVGESEAWQLVQNKSKFGTNGEDYFRLTWNAAAQQTEPKTFPPRRSRNGSQLDKAENKSLPIINAAERELKIITPQAWEALVRGNKPERLFRHGGILSRIESDDDGAPIVRPLTKERTRYELARSANWTLTVKQGDKAVQVFVQPPGLVVEDLLATPNPPLPILQRIVEAPVFSPTGILQTSPGYHPASCTYLTGNLDIGRIPSKPTKEEIQHARDLLLITLMGEFPFVSEADSAHALALALLLYVRDIIDGPTPLHLIEAPEAGTGKGLLLDVLLGPAVGRHVSIMAEARNDDEWRKRITSKLREGRSAIVIDNLATPLDSGVLSAALTALSWDDRLLGKNEIIHVPVRCLWVATGNNPILSTEVARRTIRIRLDAKQDRPWTRTGFRINDLRQWSEQNRAEIVRAALVLIQAWIAAGRPLHKQRLGSFESWSATIGGILATAEVPGFLTNLDEFYEQSDREGAVWREFIESWWNKFEGQTVGTKELFPLAQELDGFDLGRGQEKSQRTIFGRKLGQQRDRVIGQYRVVPAGTVHKVSRWRLQPKGDVGDIGGHFDPLPHARDHNSNAPTCGIENESRMSPNVPNVPPNDDGYDREERAAIRQFDGGQIDGQDCRSR